MPQELFKEFAQLDQVEAIVLGGSRAGQYFDKDSDYDVYIYLTDSIAPKTQRNILSKYCYYMEIGNQFWELEDDCVLKSDIEIELIYRTLDSFDKDLQTVVLDHQAQNAYTTCMWHNLLHSKIIYDRNGRYEALQNKYRLPYPAELKKNIIKKQLLLLDQAMPAFSKQIEKALKRQDLLSINHRSSEFFASYFDLLFALNEQTHPGEKRMLEFAKTNCPLLPQHFEENIQTYFQKLYTEPAEAIKLINQLVTTIKEIIPQEMIDGF